MREAKSYGTLDYYRYYLSTIDRDTMYEVDKNKFRSILQDYLKYVASEIIDNSKEFKLPCRLGYLSVIKHKPKVFDSKSMRIDYGETKKQGKLIYHLNLHSGFYKYRYYWDKLLCYTQNKTKYLFVASRANKRKLASIIKNGIQDYREV